MLQGVKGPRRGLRRLLPALGWLLLTGTTAFFVVGGVVYYAYSRNLPDIPRVDRYWPPILSEVYTDDMVLAGEFYQQRRKVVPYDAIPKRLVQAFIAAEDSAFFDHGGVDVVSTARAAFKSLLAKARGGGSIQGGSTLTQQTAKAVLVAAELDRIDPLALMAEAEAAVPHVGEPTNEELAAEADALRKQKINPPKTPEEERALLEEAKGRVRRKNELLRQDQVRATFIRLKEERTRTAFKKATTKKLERKIREAILALRLEAALTKEEILYLYLNNVYLGHHSYGVQSAAENYFRKDVRQLTLAEMALLAGLPQAPSRYSPFRNPETAKRRRSYVLGRMLAEGMISKEEHDRAEAEEVRALPVEDVFHSFAPYFTEEVRRDVATRYGSSVLLNDGLKIFTTMDSERQRAAQEAVFKGLIEVDKRQGYRGPLIDEPLSGEALKQHIERATKVLNGAPIEPGRFYVGVVTSIDEKGLLAEVQVGPHKGVLPLLGMRWARKVNPELYYPAVMLTSMKGVLKVGHVVLLRAVADKKGLVDDKEQWNESLAREVPDGVQLFRLEQEPELQSALVSIDPHRQYLVAMVGGYDFDANEFNRAFQSCRQPGSAFKPLTYAAAIEQLGWNQATVIVDSPIVYDDPSNQTRWKPENYDEEFKGDVLLRHALVNSMNLPAIKAFIAVGVKEMSAWSKKLGLSTPLNQDFSAALGSSCVVPAELANVYATFARYGVKKPFYFIRKIEDRWGRTIEDHTAYDDPWASLEDRVAAGYAALYEPGARVMSKETAFIMVDLMRGVVKEGTGFGATRLGKPAAGKTGTTNDSFDVWFSGFTRDLVATAWVGYDINVHPLGKYENGGRAALPIWLGYMKRSLEGRPQGEFPPPPGADLMRLRIDAKTGKRASSGSRQIVEMWFTSKTAPVEAQPEKGVVDTNQFLMDQTQ